VVDAAARGLGVDSEEADPAGRELLLQAAAHAATSENATHQATLARKAVLADNLAGRPFIAHSPHVSR
jgi:hypothetical protein